MVGMSNTVLGNGYLLKATVTSFSTCPSITCNQEAILNPGLHTPGNEYPLEIGRAVWNPIHGSIVLSG